MRVFLLLVFGVVVWWLVGDGKRYFRPLLQWVMALMGRSNHKFRGSSVKY
jgi:hypothetical protein